MRDTTYKNRFNLSAICLPTAIAAGLLWAGSKYQDSRKAEIILDRQDVHLLGGSSKVAPSDWYRERFSRCTRRAIELDPRLIEKFGGKKLSIFVYQNEKDLTTYTDPNSNQTFVFKKRMSSSGDSNKLGRDSTKEETTLSAGNFPDGTDFVITPTRSFQSDAKLTSSLNVLFYGSYFQQRTDFSPFGKKAESAFQLFCFDRSYEYFRKMIDDGRLGPKGSTYSRENVEAVLKNNRTNVDRLRKELGPDACKKYDQGSQTNMFLRAPKIPSQT